MAVSEPAFKSVLNANQWAAALAPFERPQCVAQARIKVQGQLDNVQPREPNPYDLMQTYRVLVSLDSREPDFSDVPRHHVRRTPWVLFQAMDGDDKPLASRKKLLSAYYDYLEARGPNRTIATLAHVFLRDYPQDEQVLQATRKLLQVELDRRESRRLQRLHKRCNEYSLLEADGPARFATFMEEPVDTDTLLTNAGLVAELATRGFVVSAARHWLSIVRNNLHQRCAAEDGIVYLRRLLGFFVDTSDGSLKYPDLRIALIEALLIPFAKEKPGAAVQKQIEDVLLDTFGDPRVSLGQWHGVDESAKDVLLQWLVHTTLKDFFQLVRDVSQHDSDADRMWPYREAFWTAYLNKGVIENAWVVLGYEIRQRARHQLTELGGSTYGELRPGDGAKANHAVLILQIGDAVITEWSHSGKYRLWHENDVDAPKFYQNSYRRPQLVYNPEADGAHYYSEGGTWQRKLAQEIRDRTGISITQREFMPRD